MLFLCAGGIQSSIPGGRPTETPRKAKNGFATRTLEEDADQAVNKLLRRLARGLEVADRSWIP